MIVNNPTISAGLAPASISDVTKGSAKPLANEARNNLDRQPSTVVKLSTQGLLLNQSDKPGSTAESYESRSKESSESPSVQFQEGETNGNVAPAASAPVQKAVSPGISTYLKVAAK